MLKRMSSAFTSLATMIFSLIVAAALLRLDVADGSPRKDAAPALLKIRDLMRGMPKNQDLIYEKNLPELRDAKKDHPFDHLTLTQQWPATACLNAGHHRCVVPPNVNTFTLHGLWPTSGSTHGPSFCNNSWHFHESVIDDLEPQMNRYWPNLFDDTAHTSLWKHEWTKHGTCAAAIPVLRGEHNYFESSLNLRKKYPVTEILTKSDIYPHKTRAYNVSAMSSAFQQFPGLDGKKVSLYCAYSSRKPRKKDHNQVLKTNRQYLFQVEICLNRELDPIDCLSAGSCANNRPIYYPPIKRRHFSFLSLFNRSPYVVL